jgi:phosphoribosyl-AMP cyclohydrolase
MSEITLDQFSDEAEALGLKEELSQWKAAFEAENGLVPVAAMEEILGVSRQRVWQLEKKYLWKKFTFFNKAFYSRRQMEEFKKLDRSGHRPSLPKVAQDCLADHN